MAEKNNQNNEFTEEEIKDWGEDVLYGVVEKLSEQELADAKFLSQEVTQEEFKAL